MGYEEPKNIVLKGAVVIPVIKRSMLGGMQYIYRFPNGYGASIIDHSGSYGVEMAVVEWYDAFDDHDDFTLCYSTPVAGDVLGYLTFEELIAKLGAVQALPFKSNSPADFFGITD